MKRPLSVVGTDQEALRALLTLHAPPEPRILDATANRQVMWRNMPYVPVTNDVDPSMPTDYHHDFRALPDDWTGAFDVVVFDPPHLTESGHSYANEFADRYGLKTEGLGTESIGGLFAPFLLEAQRVLVPGGVVLAKVCDQVHRARYRFQHVDLIRTAEAMGWTPCDLMIRVAMQRGALVDPRWRHIYHVRQVHTYWLCLRNGPSCMSATAPTVTRTTTAAMFEAAS